MEQDMSDLVTLLALFDDIDPASSGIAKLRESGLAEDKMEVISGIPIAENILGKSRVRSHVPAFSLVGAVLGIGAAAFFLFGIPLLYPLSVGGQPMFPFLPFLVVAFELAMLGLMTVGFLGVFIDSRFPSDEPTYYVPEVSDGKIAVVFTCPQNQQNTFVAAMQTAGAEWIRPVEAKKL
jgi:hypothetical protein